MKLTPHQQQALITGYHQSVTANAGSGKTRVLVERYLMVLLSAAAEVGEVVALTFTDKAAGEMRRKVADQIAQMLAVSADPRQTARLELIREQLPGALLGTIHSFCARVLREHPVEAGVDAAFSILEGLDQHTMVQEAMKETFRAILREGEVGASREEFVDAVRLLGKPRVVQIINHLLEKRERFERLIGPGGLYLRSDEEILAFWQEELTSAVQAAFVDPAVGRAVDRVLTSADGRGVPEVRKLSRLVWGEGGRNLLLTMDLLQKLLKSDGGLYRTIASATAEAALEEEVSLLSHVRDFALPLRPVLEGKALADHAELLRATRTLLMVCQQCLERYEQKKLDAGKLDFEDLQLKTRALLRREPVRARLASRFKFILVDEYQDTNQLQYELLLPLLNDLRSGNLFIVGDPKQSIYGFRNAEVAVFDRTCREIAARNGPQASKGHVVLEESFRPLRDVAALVNLVFGRLMGGETSPGPDYEVRYEPLVRARPNSAPGRVELLLEQEGAEQLSSEAERIAQRIALLMTSRTEIFGAGEVARPVRFDDIAVLLRSRTLLPELELALVRHGLPYAVSGGIGYFQTQDILDFYNYLRFLQHPGDDVALAGILRSPFFLVPDTELFEAVVSGRRGSLWEDLRHASSGGRLSERLHRAIVALQDDLLLGPRLPVPEILERIIVRRLVLAKLSLTSRGSQALANLEKLQRMAESYDQQGFGSLFDFTARLQRLIDDEEDEGQGAIEGQSDAVKVMTVHAAKGLEFPVVILPGLHRRFQYDREPFLHEGLGIAFARLSEENTDYPLTAYLRDESRRRTVAEEKRIFYVACTRARDLLILSGDPAVRKSTVTWMSWLLSALRPPALLDGDSLTVPCTTGLLEKKDGEYVSGVERHDLTVHLVRPKPVPLVPLPTGRSEARALSEIYIAPLSSAWKGEIFSATRIRTYQECPARYYLRYVLGFPGNRDLSVRGEEDELQDREYPAELRGRVFHSVMQRLDEISLSGGGLEEELGRLLLLEVVSDPSRSPALISEIAGMVRSVAASRFWSDVVQGRDAKTEFTISLVLGNDFLSGTLDRIYRDPSGLWHVLDFKTDRVDAVSMEERAAVYWPQLEFYALLLHRLTGARVVQAEILFTALPDRPLRRLLEAEELEKVERKIESVIARIKSGEYQPVTPPCAGCPFQGECPWIHRAGEVQGA
jgi:ATP-dependent helicase/nuclease subunit A